jgi:hypothetical protein
MDLPIFLDLRLETMSKYSHKYTCTIKPRPIQHKFVNKSITYEGSILIVNIYPNIPLDYLFIYLKNHV